MENSNSLAVRKPSLLDFRESLIYRAAMRHGDIATCRSLENLAVVRVFGIPVGIFNGGESNYSSVKVDVVGFG